MQDPIQTYTIIFEHLRLQALYCLACVYVCVSSKDPSNDSAEQQFTQQSLRLIA